MSRWKTLMENGHRERGIGLRWNVSYSNVNWAYIMLERANQWMNGWSRYRALHLIYFLKLPFNGLVSADSSPMTFPHTVSFGYGVLLSLCLCFYTYIILKMLYLNAATAHQFYAIAIAHCLRFRVKWNWRRFIALYFLDSSVLIALTRWSIATCSHTCANVVFECECVGIYELVSRLQTAFTLHKPQS